MVFFGIAVAVKTVEGYMRRAQHHLGAARGIPDQREIVLGIVTRKRKQLGLRPIADDQRMSSAVPDVGLGARIVEGGQVDGVALAESADRSV
jgi:hypothetical protein